MISITAKAPEPVRPAQSSWLGVHSSKLIAHYSSPIAHRSKKKSPASDSSDRRCNQRRARFSYDDLPWAIYFCSDTPSSGVPHVSPSCETWEL